MPIDPIVTRLFGESWRSYVARRARCFDHEREALEAFDAIVAEYGPDPDDDMLADAAHDALLVVVADA